MKNVCPGEAEERKREIKKKIQCQLREELKGAKDTDDKINYLKGTDYEL